MSSSSTNLILTPCHEAYEPLKTGMIHGGIDACGRVFKQYPIPTLFCVNMGMLLIADSVLKLAEPILKRLPVPSYVIKFSVIVLTNVCVYPALGLSAKEMMVILTIAAVVDFILKNILNRNDQSLKNPENLVDTSTAQRPEEQSDVNISSQAQNTPPLSEADQAYNNLHITFAREYPGALEAIQTQGVISDELRATHRIAFKIYEKRMLEWRLTYPTAAMALDYPESFKAYQGLVEQFAENYPIAFENIFGRQNLDETSTARFIKEQAEGIEAYHNMMEKFKTEHPKAYKLLPPTEDSDSDTDLPAGIFT